MGTKVIIFLVCNKEYHINMNTTAHIPGCNSHQAVRVKKQLAAKQTMALI